MRQKYMADRGQTNSTPFAYEQRNTEFFFQIDNLSADRRLRNMQMVCSICHMLTPGNFDEICYLPQFHSNHLTPIIAYRQDRKSTRLNSSHVSISYAVFCLKKKK